MRKPVNICYLEKRNYIDVSTICSALFNAFPEVVNVEMTNLTAKFIKKIKNECEIILDEVTEETKNASVSLTWTHKHKVHQAFLVEGKKPIECRINEPVDDPKDHISFEDGKVKLHTPINGEQVYNVMKMGRVIVFESFHKHPRVAKMDVYRFYDQENLKDVYMEMKALPKDFFLLSAYHKTEGVFADIVVKAYETIPV